MTNQLRAVVYLHEEHEGLGLLEPSLKKAGFALTLRRREARHEDVNADLLIVMGGGMGVYDQDAHPFLRGELAVLIERLAAQKSNLGICLGAQMIAAAAGSQVFAGKNGFEVGVHPVRWTKDAQSDPVFQGMRSKYLVAHWHGDTFTPVNGAVLLASTERYVQQAFRIGKSYGIQFHPELTADRFAQWLELGSVALQEKGKDLVELRAQIPKLKAAEGDLAYLSDRLAFYFAESAR